MWFTNTSCTRILSKASGLFEFAKFCSSGILADNHEYFNWCHLFYFLLSNFSNILHVTLLLSVIICINGGKF